MILLSSSRPASPALSPARSTASSVSGSRYRDPSDASASGRRIPERHAYSRRTPIAFTGMQRGSSSNVRPDRLTAAVPAHTAASGRAHQPPEHVRRGPARHPRLRRIFQDVAHVGAPSPQPTPPADTTPQWPKQHSARPYLSQGHCLRVIELKQGKGTGAHRLISAPPRCHLCCCTLLRVGIARP